MGAFDTQRFNDYLQTLWCKSKLADDFKAILNTFNYKKNIEILWKLCPASISNSLSTIIPRMPISNMKGDSFLYSVTCVKFPI